MYKGGVAQSRAACFERCFDFVCLSPKGSFIVLEIRHANNGPFNYRISLPRLRLVVSFAYKQTECPHPPPHPAPALDFLSLGPVKMAGG